MRNREGHEIRMTPTVVIINLLVVGLLLVLGYILFFKPFVTTYLQGPTVKTAVVHCAGKPEEAASIKLERTGGNKGPFRPTEVTFRHGASGSKGVATITAGTKSFFKSSFISGQPYEIPKGPSLRSATTFKLKIGPDNNDVCTGKYAYAP